MDFDFGVCQLYKGINDGAYEFRCMPIADDKRTGNCAFDFGCMPIIGVKGKIMVFLEVG